ncbi:hypothetical protein ACHAXR_004125 [Thalassiosira sp. AJA248-18]
MSTRSRSLSISKAKAVVQEEGKVISDYIWDTCIERPNKIFLTQPMGGAKAKSSMTMCTDSVRNWTFGQFLSESKKMAAHIESLDLPPSSRIAIMSKNCAWWLMADFAIMMTGHVSVPIYPSLTAGATKYVLDRSEAELVFIGKMSEDSWSEMKYGMSEEMPCVSFPVCPQGLECDKWNVLMGNTKEIETITKRTPDELATIYYTGGGAKKPEKVALSFEAMTKPTFELMRLLKITEIDRYLSYLPITQGVERWVGECVPFVTGCQVFFAESSSTHPQDIVRCRPTVFLSKQRLWSKLHRDLCKVTPPHKLEKLANASKNPINGWGAKKTQKALLKALGLDQCRYAGCDNESLPPDLLAWYRSLGLEFLDGYGTTNISHCKCQRVQ